MVAATADRAIRDAETKIQAPVVRDQWRRSANALAQEQRLRFAQHAGEAHRMDMVSRGDAAAETLANRGEFSMARQAVEESGWLSEADKNRRYGLIDRSEQTSAALSVASSNDPEAMRQEAALLQRPGDWLSSHGLEARPFSLQPEQVRQIRHQLEGQAAAVERYREQAAEKAQDNLYDRWLDVVYTGAGRGVRPSFTQIPADLNGKHAQSAFQVVKSLQEGRAEDDADTRKNLAAMLYTSPERFLRTNLNLFRGQLTPATFEHYLERQAALRREGLNGPALTQLRTDRGIVEGVINTYLAPDGKLDPKLKPQADEFIGLIEGNVRAFEQRERRKPGGNPKFTADPSQIREIAEATLSPQLKSRGWLWWKSSRLEAPVSEMSGLSGFAVPLGRIVAAEGKEVNLPNVIGAYRQRQGAVEYVIGAWEKQTDAPLGPDQALDIVEKARRGRASIDRDLRSQGIVVPEGPAGDGTRADYIIRLTAPRRSEPVPELAKPQPLNLEDLRRKAIKVMGPEWLRANPGFGQPWYKDKEFVRSLLPISDALARAVDAANKSEIERLIREASGQKEEKKAPPTVGEVLKDWRPPEDR